MAGADTPKQQLAVALAARGRESASKAIDLLNEQGRKKSELVEGLASRATSGSCAVCGTWLSGSYSQMTVGNRSLDVCSDCVPNLKFMLDMVAEAPGEAIRLLDEAEKDLKEASSIARDPEVKRDLDRVRDIRKSVKTGSSAPSASRAGDGRSRVAKIAGGLGAVLVRVLVADVITVLLLVGPYLLSRTLGNDDPLMSSGLGLFLLGWLGWGLFASFVLFEPFVVCMVDFFRPTRERVDYQVAGIVFGLILASFTLGAVAYLVSVPGWGVAAGVVTGIVGAALALFVAAGVYTAPDTPKFN
jgi:hypothetical protein